MATIQYVQTISAPFSGYGADLHALTILPGTMTLWGLAGYGTNRIATFDVTSGATHIGDIALGAGQDGYVTANYGPITAYLSATLTAEIINVAPAQMQDGWTIFSQNTGLAADQVTLVGLDMAGNDFLVGTVAGGGDGIATFFRAANGSLSLVSTHYDPALGPVSDVATVTAYGQTWIVTATPGVDAVQSYTVDALGNLTHQASYGAIEGLGINNPAALEPFMIGGQPYVLLASPDTHSLSVLRLEGDGSFTATDHILDDLGTRFANPAVIDVVQSGGNTYAVASGSDDGFSLFRILGDGTLSLIGTYADTNAVPLDNISALALVVDGPTLRLFTGSDTEAGLGHFSTDLSGYGGEITGSAAADMLVGTGLGDVILAGAGDDVVDGGAGADLIRDGAGSDNLTGGAGADIFALIEDGTTDTITDFERGVDGLDLSYYALIHDIADITHASTSWGARLTIKGDVVNIYSKDGNPLSLADLTAFDPFPVDRPPLILSPGSSGAGSPNVFVGTGAAEVLSGTSGDDILTGNGGDDVLIGGAGADQLMGGAGFDIASYSTAAGPVTVNLSNLGQNTGHAAGDTYSLIEGVEGSGFSDSLTGRNSADLLMGGAGDDQLFGLAGDDILKGGTGNDWLDGGTGADRLEGGAGTDWAVYTGTATIWADLANAGRNKGDASGDSYSSIENLWGGDGQDWLFGDDQSNHLTGNSGDDRLNGRGGSDILDGGAGDDILLGGTGANQLIGGAGTDRVDYSWAKSGVTASLANDLLNAGLAQGDTFASVEDLSGSLFDDTLYGDGAANRLFGLDGNDQLFGAAGNDMLWGGRGDDQLSGGTGDDRIWGGSGTDDFLFQAGDGHDVIGDFEDGIDQLEIDLALMGATPATTADLIASFASVQNGNIVIDFGADSITLIGHADASILYGDVAFF